MDCRFIPRRRFIGFVTLVALFVLSSSALAAKMITINVDFSNSSMIKDSDGATITCVPPPLTGAQQTAIAVKIQMKYEDIYGVGNVTINILNLPAASKNPPAADQTVVITNSTAPGKEYGDAGAANGPAIVYLKQFTDNGFKLDSVANYIGETAAHEVGHKLGIAHNGEDNTLMSKGSNVTRAQRVADARSFTAAEAKKILDNTVDNGKPTGGVKQCPPLKDTPAPQPGAASSLGWNAGVDPTPPPKDPATAGFSSGGYDYNDDNTWNALANLSSDTIAGNNLLSTDQLQVGYINAADQFFELADPFATFTDGSSDKLVDFGGLGSVHNTADMALYDPATGHTYDYSTTGENIGYSVYNPYNHLVSLEASIGFNLTSFGLGDVTLLLNAQSSATGESTTGGFTGLTDVPLVVPMPAGFWCGMALLGVVAGVSVVRKGLGSPATI